MAPTDRVAAALADLDRALGELRRRPKPRKPATAAALAKLEAAWARPLPPTYRALLELRDGFADKANDPEVIGLFSAGELVAKSPVMREAAEWKQADPDCVEAKRGLVIGRTLDAWTLLDPGSARGGELGVVTIDSEYEVVKAADVAAYLAACAVSARALKTSNEFVKATKQRAQEIEQQGAQIMGVTTSAVSPDGRVLAVLWGNSLNVFDLAAAVERDRSRYAPCTHWVDAIAIAPVRVAFSTDSALVVCIADDGVAVAFDVKTGEPRPVPAAQAIGATVKISNRFNRRDGIRLP